jgi:hypothetical protein
MDDFCFFLKVLAVGCVINILATKKLEREKSTSLGRRIDG